MYNAGQDNKPNSNFFNFRELGGIQINKVADIPYDFYALVPTFLQPLYQMMRRERQWYSGYVSGVHNRLLSSRIIPTVTNILTDKIVGRGYKFDGEDELINFFNAWDRKVNFADTVERCITDTSTLGFSFLKLDVVGGHLTPTPVQADQAFWLSENREIVDFKSTVMYTGGNELEESTYLMEHRFYKNGKPMIRHFFTKSSSQFSENASELKNFERGMSLNVPLLHRFGFDVRSGENFIKRLEEQGIYINATELPFKNGLGVELIRATVNNPTYAKQPIGQGIMSQIGEDGAIRYELAFSLACHETSIAPQSILVPQGFNNGSLNGSFDNGQVFSDVKKIDKTYYVKVPFGNGDGESQEPKAIEFNVRADEILKMQSIALKHIATAIGLSPNDLNISQEQAVYVSKDAKADSSENMIRRRRRLMESAFYTIVEEVKHFYEIDGKVDLLWTDMAVNDFATELNSMVTAVKSFLISPEEAINRLYPDKTPTEKAILMKGIAENRQEIVNTFYGGANQNNTSKEQGVEEQNSN